MLSHLQQLIWDETQTNTWIAMTVGGTFVKSNRSVYAPHLVQSVLLHLFKHSGGDVAHQISMNKCPRRRLSGSYTARISVKISRICEFRAIMGIMTSLLGCCCPAPLRAGRMIMSKLSLRSGFDCIIPPAPSGAGRTTPPQPGHCPLTNCVIWS